MPAMGNAELLAGCARGEAEAWDETVDRFGRLVWSVARSHRVSRVDAEDVRQVTWFRLMQNADRIRDPDRLGDWLATVARREAIKAATRDRRLVMVGDSATLEHFLDHHESPEQITLRADRGQEVLRAIDSLSDQCRELLLRALQDPPASYQEIAAALSMPLGSVGPIRTRCLRRLRRALDRDGAVPAASADDCTRCPARTSAAPHALAGPVEAARVPASAPAQGAPSARASAAAHTPAPAGPAEGARAAASVPTPGTAPERASGAGYVAASVGPAEAVRASASVPTSGTAPERASGARYATASAGASGAVPVRAPETPHPPTPARTPDGTEVPR